MFGVCAIGTLVFLGVFSASGAVVRKYSIPESPLRITAPA